MSSLSISTTLLYIIRVNRTLMSSFFIMPISIVGIGSTGQQSNGLMSLHGYRVNKIMELMLLCCG